MKTRSSLLSVTVFSMVTAACLMEQASVVACTLNVPQDYQEQDQWCWAASSQAVLTYYGTNLTQTQIAQYGTDGADIPNYLYGSSSNPTMRGVDLILNYFRGIISTPYASSLSQTFVRTEICTNARPVVIRWGWDSGGGHILVVRGLEVDGTVYLMDPWYGPTINSYSWVVSGGGHTWTHSLPLNCSPTFIGLSGNLAFGSVQVNTIAQRTLTISNSGISDFHVSSINYPIGFSGNWSSGTISAGGLQNVTVTFAPTAASSYGGTVTVNSDATSGISTSSASGNGALPVYTVTTSASPATGGTTSGGGTYEYGSNVTVCATANSCYGFVNWTDQNSDAVSTSACYSFTATGNETLVANFTPATYTYTVSTSSSPSGGGSTSGGGTYECGSNVTVCATANSCYGFVNWTVNGNVVSASACYSFTAPGDATLMANFAPFTYTVSTGSSPPSGGTTGGDGTYECGSNVTVCATANSCYGFVNWTDQNSNVVSTSACYSFTATGNETLVANFAPSSGSTSGGLTPLWSFTGNSDGADPVAGLVQGSDGNFYGTTGGGGANGNGTVFRVTPSGSLTNLWSFTGNSDGADPAAGLVQGSDGNFYGTTGGGGANGNGTVFRIAPSGSLTNLWSFTVGSDGDWPGALVQGSDGNFYGTTYDGGAYGWGTVFRITPSGSLTALWSFTGGNDGGLPVAGLVQGSDGNFYGTTGGGGANGNGTVFRVTPSGSLTNLWSFTGCSDGASPAAGLVQGSDGNFYGTTEGSGSGPSANGTVFKLIISRTITTSSSPPDGGSTSGAGVYAVGSNVTVCATANSCYGFVNWTDQNSNVVSTSACYTFTAAGDETLVANFALVDSVGDGILDVWRQSYFGGSGTTTNNLSCATCDADGTGQNNLFKYVAGLDPTNPASVFILEIVSVPNQSAQENLLFNPVVTGRTYTPQFSTDLVSGIWSPLATYTGPVTNDGNQVTITDTNAIESNKFYRIRITYP
jgi:uncharacterized repeat protein (TIGR03803 family)